MKRGISKISRVYAEALFNSCRSSLIDDFIKVIEYLSANDRELYEVLVSPVVPQIKKIELTNKIFNGSVNEKMNRFLLLVVERKRIKDIFEIFYAYKEMVNRSKGIVGGELKISDGYSTEDISGILEVVSNIVGMKTELDVVKDKELVAGFRGMVGDKFVDYSILGHLQKMETELK
jgi:F-type H+-transporting ATPase subunit delta